MNDSFAIEGSLRFAQVSRWRLAAVPTHGDGSATNWVLDVLQPQPRLLRPGMRLAACLRNFISRTTTLLLEDKLSHSNYVRSRIAFFFPLFVSIEYELAMCCTERCNVDVVTGPSFGVDNSLFRLCFRPHLSQPHIGNSQTVPGRHAETHRARLENSQSRLIFMPWEHDCLILLLEASNCCEVFRTGLSQVALEYSVLDLETHISLGLFPILRTRG